MFGNKCSHGWEREKKRETSPTKRKEMWNAEWLLADKIRSLLNLLKGENRRNGGLTNWSSVPGFSTALDCKSVLTLPVPFMVLSEGHRDGNNVQSWACHTCTQVPCTHMHWSLNQELTGLLICNLSIKRYCQLTQRKPMQYYQQL